MTRPDYTESDSGSWLKDGNLMRIAIICIYVRIPSNSRGKECQGNVTNTPAQQHIGLDELPSGSSSRVVAIQGEGRATRELLTLGLIPGVRISVLRRGIGGDPLEVAAGGHPVCLRRSQSRLVRVRASAAKA